MAESSRDHAAFDWLMRHMDELVATSPRVWVASDGDRLVAMNASLGELLALLPPDPERFAVAYVRAAPQDGPPSGGRTKELPQLPSGFDRGAVRFESPTDQDQDRVLFESLKDRNAG